MNRKQKSIGQAIIIAVIMLILGCGVLMAITKGFTDWNPYGWFNKQPDKEETATETAGFVYDGEGNAMTSNMSYAMPSAMVFSSTSVESRVASQGVTITPIIKPDYATNKNVTWSIEWDTESTISNWDDDEGVDVTGSIEDNVEDYVKLNGNSTSANLTCIKAFGTPIILKCWSTAQPNMSATCKILYRQKYNPENYVYEPYGDLARSAWTMVRLADKNVYSPTIDNISIESQTYTNALNVTNERLTLYATDDFIGLIEREMDLKVKASSIPFNYFNEHVYTDNNRIDFSSQALCEAITGNITRYKDFESVVTLFIRDFGRENMFYIRFTYDSVAGVNHYKDVPIRVTVDFSVPIESLSISGSLTF